MPPRANLRSLRRAFANLGVLQIDAVNAVARSHLLVLRPRLGGDHDSTRDLLERAAYTSSASPGSAGAASVGSSSAGTASANAGSAGATAGRQLTEYWCHEAAFCAVEDWPLYRWRMRRGETGELWKPLATFAAQNRRNIDNLLKALERHGPASVSELETATGADTTKPPKREGQWTHWNDTKKALGWLFWAGYVGVAQRVSFARRYDLIERVLPAEIVARQIDEQSAQRELLLQAARCQGVGTAADLGDYFRLPKREAPARIAELVEDKKLVPVQVQGWSHEAYMLPGTKAVRRSSQSVLLSPFDPLVWFRPRGERLFDFHYRLEIYTPAAKRRYGYYVLPFLHEDRLAARVDVRSDRAGQVLQVLGAFSESGDAAGAGGSGSGGSSGGASGSGGAGGGNASAGGAGGGAAPAHSYKTPIEVALAQELVALAQWLGLSDVEIEPTARGDLTPPLHRVLTTSGR